MTVIGSLAAGLEQIPVYRTPDGRSQSAHGGARCPTPQLCTAEGMVCEWCGVASANGNHATIQECVEALEREVAMLKQAVTERERFLERMRQSKDPHARGRWKFKNP